MSPTLTNEIVLIRNLRPGPTCHTYEGPHGKGTIEWSGAGDPDSGDVQEVPAHLLSDRNLRRAIARGVLQVESADDDLMEQVEAAAASWRNAQAAHEEAARASIDQSSNNDMIAVRCLGPGARGGQCEENVVVNAKNRGAKPPLCLRHQSLSSQFVLTEVEGKRVDGATTSRSAVKWARAGMTARNEVFGEEAF